MNAKKLMSKISVILIFTMALIFICPLMAKSTVTVSPTGSRMLQKYKPAKFIGIKATSDFTIHVYPSDVDSATVIIDKVLIPYFKMEIQNGYFYPKYTQGLSKRGFRDNPVINIYCTNLEQIHVNGSADLKMMSTFDSKGKELMVSGSGAGDMLLKFKNVSKCNVDISGACDAKIIIEGQTTSFMCKVSGSSDLNLNVGKVANFVSAFSGASGAIIVGSARYASIGCNGSSDVVARNFNTEEAVLKATGASDISVSVSKEIKAIATGSSGIKYYGNPVRKAVSSSGSGSVINVRVSEQNK